MNIRSFGTAFTALLLTLASFSLALAQPGLERALQVKQANNPNFFADPDVVATGVSVDENGQAVIKVYTRVGKAKNVPNAVQGVGVVQVISGDFFAGDRRNEAQRGKPNRDNPDDPQARQARPVPIGVSIGSTGPNICFAGTLGCRLQRMNLSTGNIDFLILSNNHVIADENGGVIGSDQIIQPGTLDNNCTLDSRDVIGTLVDFEPIAFNGSANFVDAAVATTNPGDTGFATPDSAYGAPTSTVETAFPGMLVKKFGRTTGYTEGVVDSIDVTVNVGYDNGTATFVDQIVIQGQRTRGKRLVAATFSDGGDSGSLIVTQDGNDPMGLLFAGNTSFTIANPMQAVLDTFSGSNSVVIVDSGN